MRSKAAERARYVWLTTQGFADAIGVQRAQVLALIHEGWFQHEGGAPECMNVAVPGAKKPEYRIHPDALKRFYRERAA
jgi:hypothetical protein